MLSQKQRLLLTAIHRWAGVGIALLLLFQACTGMLLSFKDVWAQAMDPAMRSSPMRGDSVRVSPDQVMDAALAAAGDCRPRRLYFPKGERGVFLLKCERGPDRVDWIVTVDAHRGEVLASAPTWKFPFEFADEWHLELRAGSSGRAIVGGLGLALTLLAIAGLVVWWPGMRNVVRVMKPAWRGGARRRLLILHRLVGPGVFTFALVLAGAGCLTAWRPWVEPMVARVLPLTAAPALPGSSGSETLLPLAEVERLALEAFPGASVRDIRDRNGGYEVVQVVINPVFEARPRAADHAWVDRRSGTLLAAQSTASEPAGSRLLGWILPVHTGEWLGLPGRLLMLLTGLSILALTISGVASTFMKPRPSVPKANAPSAPIRAVPD
jgi:uncharacterized iron-regulated membrane protein